MRPEQEIRKEPKDIGLSQIFNEKLSDYAIGVKDALEWVLVEAEGQ